MRRSGIIFIIIILMIATFAYSGEYSNFFWQVEKGDITVNLCGSVHLMRPDYYPLREEIEQAFEESEILVLEFDINKIDMNKIQELINTRGLYPEGDSLKTDLGEEYYEKLGSELAEYKYTVESVKNQKPWYMTMTLSSVRVSELGYTAEGGTDLYFAQKAKGHKEIQQLETAEAQFEMLSGMDEHIQIEYLKELIDKREEFNQEVEELMQSWIAGDDSTMYRLMNEEIKENPELTGYYDKLFTERNLNMTDKIEQYLTGDNKKEYFIVVGSGHYLGEDGIVNLLRERGYSVVRK
ncbi:MAG: TraB/GumN family protein [Candidatus Stygibacter australis]|nr:TraB/GumN family protein [Candidatus Stygibacter australis]MDP8322739.1 TraB/GumN family protein [Candidatus Stygibacter australis]